MSDEPNVIPFPQTKDPFDFEGMDIKINVAQDRKTWDSIFVSVQLADRFCQFDHVRAERAARTIMDSEDEGDAISDVLAHMSESIDYLEAIIEFMETAGARIAISADRVMERR